MARGIIFYKRIWETKPCRGSNKLRIASEMNPGFTEWKKKQRKRMVNNRIEQRFKEEN